MRQLLSWESDLQTLLVAADVLALGGDHRLPSGAAHGVAKPWTRSWENPAIYSDSFARVLRAHGGLFGLPEGNADALSTFLETYQLFPLLAQIKEAVEGLPMYRRMFIGNLVDALDVVVRASSQVGDSSEPSFEDRYRVATRYTGSIDLINVDPVRTKLRQLLKQQGYETEHLVDAVALWEENQGRLDYTKIPGRVDEILCKLIPLVKERLLVPLGITLPEQSSWRTLGDVPFDGLDFEMFSLPNRPEITAAQSYFAGNICGRRALEGLFEYNQDYPMTYLGLVALCLHEFMPGHYLHSVATDLLPHQGIESSMPTMCTPQVTLWEGVAQSALDFLFDSRQEAYTTIGFTFGVDPKDVAIQYVCDLLLDAAKHDGPILHQVRGLSEEEVRARVSQDYALTDPLPSKIWGWARHSVIGPMYGGSYERGRQVVGKAIQDFGRLAAAKVAYGVHGTVDIETFQCVLKENYARK
jgi:hypothetical protein